MVHLHLVLPHGSLVAIFATRLGQTGWSPARSVCCAGKDALGWYFAFLVAFLRSAHSGASATLNELHASLQQWKNTFLVRKTT